MSDLQFIPYRSRELHRSHGRVIIEITCPICETAFRGHVWSLAGGGKKCPGCGTYHNHYAAIVEKPAPTAAQDSRIGPTTGEPPKGEERDNG